MPTERRQKPEKERRVKAGRTGKLSAKEQAEIDKAVDKVFEDYGETLRRLGRE